MSVRISWSPSTYQYIASYDIEVGSAAGGPFSFLANVVHDLGGLNYDTESGLFFYDHAAGVLTNWYRIVAKDTSNNSSVPSAPIEPTSATPVIAASVLVDHNYGTPGALRYQRPNGTPIENAIIRIYPKAAFDQGELDAPLAITMTNSQGNWVNPVSLEVGQTYTVQFHLPGLYGPDKVDVIV